MLESDQSFSWDIVVAKAFQQMKDSISSVPALATPDSTKYFIIYTNATEESIFGLVKFHQYFSHPA